MHSKAARLPVMAMAMALAALLLVSSGSSVATVERLPEGLPTPTSMASAVYTGEAVYVFGGFTQGALLDTMVEVDPATGRSRVLEWRLPSPRKLSSAVWTGDAVYIIGGVGYDAVPLREVVRFVPGVGVELLRDAIPWGTKGVSAVWSGEMIYVFGNCLSAEEGHRDIIRYDPVDNRSEVLEDVLPVPGAGSSAIWTDGAAYVFGGRLNESFSDMVIRFQPGKGVKVMDGRLPSPRFGTASVWDGSRAYVLGGSIALACGPVECVPTDYLDEIVVYDPLLDVASAHRDPLPDPMDLRAAVWLEGRVMVLGGQRVDGPVDWVLSIDPDRSEPAWDHARRAVLAAALVAGVAILVVITVRGLRIRRGALERGPER